MTPAIMYVQLLRWCNVVCSVNAGPVLSEHYLPANDTRQIKKAIFHHYTQVIHFNTKIITVLDITSRMNEKITSRRCYSSLQIVSKFSSPYINKPVKTDHNVLIILTQFPRNQQQFTHSSSVIMSGILLSDYQYMYYYYHYYKIVHLTGQFFCSYSMSPQGISGN